MPADPGEVNLPMSSPSIAAPRTLLALVLATLLAAGAVACSSSQESASPDPSSSAAPDATATTTPETTAPGGGPIVTTPRQPCSAATLGAAASASFAAPTIADLVCEAESASATIANGPNGETLALFQLQDGAWALVASGPVADLAAVAAPASFSTTAIPSWQRLRDARLKRAASPSPPGAGQGPNGDNPKAGCRSEGDVYICPDTTMAPVVPDPENPDAPATVPASGFCKYNYNDPRCVSDPSFSP